VDSISGSEDGLPAFAARPGSLGGMGDESRLTWLGHSTVLVELDGVRLLTDPVLRPRILHLRRRVPAAPRDLLVDAALVSHVHWDHLDLRSLARLGKSIQVVVPRGVGPMLRRRGFERVDEVEAGDVVEAGAVAVQATHAEHEAYRWRRASAVPALGYLLRASRTVYFAGDTDLFDAMDGLTDGLDVALLPVSGWGPTLPAGHLDPRRAAEALCLLRPRVAVPIHWGTYSPLGSRPVGGPAEEFRTAAAELAPGVEIRVLRVGERLAF
jgi:L-ascorbate metabolism protein UlaG (beta-lactamase superfamily)